MSSSSQERINNFSLMIASSPLKKQIILMKTQPDLKQRVQAFYRYTLLLLTAFSLVMASCKRDDSVPPASKIIDVYVAGEIAVEVNNNTIKYPAYWKNGNEVRLSATDAGFVSAIAVSGPNVYCAGYIATEPNKIILWKNQETATHLPLSASASYARVTGITVSGTDVYVIGYEFISLTNIATYWKVGASTGIPLSNSNASEGNAIAVSSAKKVYVAGYEKINSNTAIAKYWIDNSTTETNLTLNGGGQLTGIALSGDDVYVAGYEDNTIKLWKNNGQPENTTALGVSGKSTTYNNCIAISGTDVYVAGTDNLDAMLKNGIVKYWKKSTLNTSAAVATTLSQGSNIFANAIAVAGGNVYVTGSKNVAFGDDRSYLWKNNGTPIAPFDGTKKINATALCVVER